MGIIVASMHAGDEGPAGAPSQSSPFSAPAPGTPARALPETTGTRKNQGHSSVAVMVGISSAVVVAFAAGIVAAYYMLGMSQVLAGLKSQQVGNGGAAPAQGSERAEVKLF